MYMHVETYIKETAREGRARDRVAMAGVQWECMQAWHCALTCVQQVQSLAGLCSCVNKAHKIRQRCQCQTCKQATKPPFVSTYLRRDANTHIRLSGFSAAKYGNRLWYLDLWPNVPPGKNSSICRCAGYHNLTSMHLLPPGSSWTFIFKKVGIVLSHLPFFLIRFF